MIEYFSSNALSTNTKGSENIQLIFSLVKLEFVADATRCCRSFRTTILYQWLGVFLQTWGFLRTQWDFLFYKLDMNDRRKELQGFECCTFILFGCKKLRPNDDASWTPIQLLYTSVVNQFLSINYPICLSTKDVDDMVSYVEKLKASFWRMFGPHCQKGLNELT